MRYGLFAALLLGCCSQLANAAIISKDFHVYANGNSLGIFPFNDISLDVSITFDNSADINTTTTGLTISNFNASGYFSLKYTYDAADDYIVIATNPIIGSYYKENPGMGFFVFNISTTLEDPAGHNTKLYYSTKQRTFDADRVISTGSAVPEPAAWALMIGGFGMVGAAARRSRARVRFDRSPAAMAVA